MPATRVLLTLSLIVGTIAATATPAHAASYVTGCFRYNKPGFNLTSIPVQLQVYTVGGWYTIASTSLPPSQCVAWNINATYRSYYVRMLVNYQLNGALWLGSSPMMALPGEQAAQLGTGVVTCGACTY